MVNLLSHEKERERMLNAIMTRAEALGVQIDNKLTIAQIEAEIEHLRNVI